MYSSSKMCTTSTSPTFLERYQTVAVHRGGRPPSGSSVLESKGGLVLVAVMIRLNSFFLKRALRLAGRPSAVSRFPGCRRFFAVGFDCSLRWPLLILSILVRASAAASTDFGECDFAEVGRRVRRRAGEDVDRHGRASPPRSASIAMRRPILARMVLSTASNAAAAAVGSVPGGAGSFGAVFGSLGAIGAETREVVSATTLATAAAIFLGATSSTRAIATARSLALGAKGAAEGVAGVGVGFPS